MNGDGGDIYAVSSASRKIRKVLDDIKVLGHSKVSPFAVGRVEKRMADYARANGITLGSKSIYMGAKSLAHATRGLKVKRGIRVSDVDLVSFPQRKSSMSLYYDTTTKNFTYTNGSVKYVLHPNYKIKLKSGKTRVVNFITASKTDGKEFNQKNYRKI